MAAESTLMKAGAQPSLIKKLANRYGLEAGKFYNSIISVVWPTWPLSLWSATNTI
jgi:hypothetical protein